MAGQQTAPQEAVTGTDELSSRFGKLEKPHPEFSELEGIVKPKSLHVLDDESAEWLRSLMDVTTQGLGTSRFVYSALPILWLIDRDGVLRFAVEEVVKVDNKEFVYARTTPKSYPIKVEIPSGCERIGHPSLVGGAAARIGGEIRFDIRATPPKWIIDNSSGRYGFQSDRTKKHLLEVVQLFQYFNIELAPLFLGPDA